MLRSLNSDHCAGARVQAAGAGGGRRPYKIALHADAVDDVVAQTGGQLSEGVDAPGRDAAQSAHGAGPHVAGALIEREREHGLVRQALFFLICDRAKDFPRAVFVQA